MFTVAKAGLRACAAGLGFAAVLGLATASQAEIVANLGVLSPGATEIVGCNTTPSCTSTTGTAGGQLPASGTFTHQILFGVTTTSATLSTTLIQNNVTTLISPIDVANLTVKLFLSTGGTGVVGTTQTHGATALATAVATFLPASSIYTLSFSGLLAGNTYIVELLGGGLGVTNSDANYSQHINVVAAPVPLPPALFLLGAALFGLIGFARMRRNGASV